MRMLDLEAVQAFVLVADLKSFTRTAEAMATTQSAISLKIKRLEEEIGRRLVERTPRLVRLSSDGARFLERARELIASHKRAVDAFGTVRRRLVVGINHHIVGPDLPLLIRRMNDAEPNVVLELRIGSSRETLADFDAGSIDAAIVLARDHRRDDAEVIFSAPFMWAASRDFDYARGSELRLATQSTPCIIRTMAVETLDQAAIPWTEVFIGGGITTIGAAVSAGLAVAALSRRVAPVDAIDAGVKFGLPALPNRDVIMTTSVSDPPLRAALRNFAAILKASTT